MEEENKSYKKKLVCLTLALMLATSITYIFFFLATPVDFTCLWTNVNYNDNFMYQAFSRQVEDGYYIFYNPYSTDPIQPFFFNTYVIAVGIIHKLLGLPLILVYHLFRLILIPVFLLVLWRFLRIFIDDEEWRWWTVLFVTTSSGISYLLVPFKDHLWHYKGFYDIHVPESIVFSTLSTFPHMTLALVLMLIVVRQYYVGLVNRKTGSIVIACILTCLIGTFHPYDTVYLAVMLSLWCLVMMILRRIGITFGIISGTAFGLSSVAPVLLQLYIASRSPEMQSWVDSAVMNSYSFPYFILGFGFILIGAVYWLICRIYKRNYKNVTAAELLIICWFLTGIGLLYLPVSVQRRFIMGTHIVLCIMFVLGLRYYLLPWLAGREMFLTPLQPSRFLVILVMILSLGNVFWVGFYSPAGIFGYHQNWDLHYLPYLHENDIEAIDWAGESLPPFSSILCSPKLASFVPSRTPLRTILGHPHLSPGYYTEFKKMEYFLQEKPDPDRLKKNIYDLKAEYFYYGTLEMIFWKWDPDKLPFLQKIYNNELVSIYRVIPENEID